MGNEKTFVLKGNIIYSKDASNLILVPNGYLICKEGKSEGVYEYLPKEYEKLPIIDYKDKLILPGFVDLHTHAPQYAFRGLGMDYQLLEWLDKHTFPEEAKYKDMEYAKKAYEIFVDDLKMSVTTRACIYGTVHEEATILLMELIEKSGIYSMVGKVNMDRNAPDYLCEKDAKESEERTRRWLGVILGRFQNVKPILTPRFIPSCSDELMNIVSKIQKENQLPVQSHLSENQEEIEWVKELCPNANSYGDAYDSFGLFGRGCPTVMAHCVYLTEEEIQRIKDNKVFVAICAESNMNLSSGIAPIGRFSKAGLKIGLGTDIAAASSLSMLKVIVNTIQASKLYWRLVDESVLPIGIEEAFYLATKGGGAFFGNVGSFEKGYEFDAVIIDDTRLVSAQELNLRERFERVIYLSDDKDIISKYVGGTQIFEGID